MELRHDWKTLNDVLFAQTEKEGAGENTNKQDFAVVVRGQGTDVDSVLANGKYVRAGEDELLSNSAGYSINKVLVVSRNDLNQYVSDVAGYGSNYYQQLAHLRERITGNQKKNPVIFTRKHFVVDLFTSWVRKFLPNRFNVLVFIDSRSSISVNSMAPNSASYGYKSILLSFNSGKLDQFYEPDFTSLHAERLVEWSRDHKLVGQYLENRYLIPCYSLFVYRDIWEKMLQASADGASPWPVLVRYRNDGRSAITPDSFLVKTWIFFTRIRSIFKK